MGFKSTVVARTSNITGNDNEMALPLTRDELVEGLKKHAAGGLIQDCFPDLSAPQREFLITGITPEEWDEHVNPIECQTCKRRMDEDYTIGCPECLDHEHADEGGEN
jgi:hypothetical protein